MIVLEQARGHLEQRGLGQAALMLKSRLESASRGELPYAEYLLDVEISARRERYLKARTRLARLPFQRTLDQFDFGFQPSIDQRQVKELATMAFAYDAANVILLGPPGVGKTHPAVALGLRGIESGLGVLLHPCQRPAGGPAPSPGRAPPGPPGASTSHHGFW